MPDALIERGRFTSARQFRDVTVTSGDLGRSGVEVYAVPTLERLSQGATWWNSATPGMDLLDDWVCLATANPTGRDPLGLQVYDVERVAPDRL